jgi:hypothetical protein
MTDINKVIPKWILDRIKERFRHITDVNQVFNLTDDQLLSVTMFGKMRLQRLRAIKPQIPTRQFCAICGHLHKIDFRVPDSTWKAVIHPSYRNSIVCINCFMERGDEKFIQWEKSLILRPCSFHTQKTIQNDRTNIY